MTIRWSPEARDDVDRLVDFLTGHDSVLADEIERLLVEAPKRLLPFHRRGPRLTDFDPREVRELRVDNYVLRYELAGSDLIVLRFFHARENRFHAPPTSADH